MTERDYHGWTRHTYPACRPHYPGYLDFTSSYQTDVSFYRLVHNDPVRYPSGILRPEESQKLTKTAVYRRIAPRATSGALSAPYSETA